MEGLRNGDRVVVNSPFKVGVLKGMTGRIVVDDDIDHYGIEFDEDISGHDCGVTDCKSGHGWFLSRRLVELYEEPQFDTDDSSLNDLLG